MDAEAKPSSSYMWRSVVWGMGLLEKGVHWRIGDGSKLKSTKSVEIPLKVEIFIWKACHEWIPTMINLARLGIVVQPLFPICKKKDETTVHALWGCRNLKLICDAWPSISGAKPGPGLSPDILGP
ncbi:hypothetical protein Dsin_012013 [Dipteronia sinensis]|uniref:Reverse transcriptase zinc-binding domain-containing protein n=1 Tax=Dipteronia sinensis TaxID=43782 RepID=A0AAE0AHQ2_9ROSI|nr:hypothetical protein Dsin_012013 [Dipteronia sinensis]